LKRSEGGKGEDRDAVRSNVFLAAVIEAPGGPFPVRIRNVSVSGALLEGPELPQEGTPVDLRRGHLSAKGEVAWRDEDQCGVRFEASIVVAAWVKRVGHTGQEQVDRAVASLRRPGFAGPIETAPQAADLQTISASLDEICERLANSKDLSIEIAEELLKLDTIAQSLRRFTR
jgi:hypothetical protein